MAIAEPPRRRCSGCSTCRMARTPCWISPSGQGCLSVSFDRSHLPFSSTICFEKRMNSFSGQTAVITGATGGVGRAIAERLITGGARALLVGRSQESLGSIVRQHGWDPQAASCCAVDLRAESEIARFVSHVRATDIRIDQIIHAAGIIALDDPEDEHLHDFDAQYEVNVRAPYQLTRG